MAKRSKRGLAAFLLVCLMLSVTACGGSREEPVVSKADAEKIREEAEAEMKARHQERMEDSRERAEVDEEDDRSAAAEQEEEVEAVPEREADEKPEKDEEVSEDGYVKGTVTSTTFESEWIGLRYDLPDGFTMSSEEDMDAVLKAGGSLLYEDKVDDIVDYAKMIMVYEMMAKDEYGNVITLFVEKSNYDIDTYVAGIKMQMGNVDAMDITMDDGETVEVGGVEFEKYSLIISYGGVEMKEDYYLRKKGNRMICMLTGYMSDDAAETIMGGFSPY